MKVVLRVSRYFKARMYKEMQPRNYTTSRTASIINLLDESRVPKVQSSPLVYQISNRSTVYLITNGDPKRFPVKLQQFLNDKDILKVGVNASHDAEWLKNSYNIKCQGIVDIESIAKEKGYSARSLAELTAMFGDGELVLKKTRKILKWNFDAPKLDPELILYASSDAFAGIQVYENIRENKMNRVYLNYEKIHPMTREDEEKEMYEILLQHCPKGKSQKQITLIQLLENKYMRWIKTKPKSLIRHQEVVKTIKKFIEDGRLVEIKQQEKSNSNTKNENDQSIDVIQNSESSNAEAEKLVKIPGVPIETILGSSFAKQLLISKGLSSEDCTFLKEISPYVLRAIRKDSLARLYINDGKSKSIDSKDEQVVKGKLGELSRVCALMPGVKWNTLMINTRWLEELEKGYDEVITKGRGTEGVTSENNIEVTG
ncbi:15100_t:CDS:2 [Acaulospora colombiana]|uniref:15100_t:CDS:1 n=1 Tax=Acaulospora colombiana TaxID=27376 RepID=A0ACA9LGZ2_9GLOM|nr:15100_t:CDS:2 [Acaulospora colombiana]